MRLCSSPTATEGLPHSFPRPHLLLAAGLPTQRRGAPPSPPRDPRRGKEAAGTPWGGAWRFGCATARAANREFVLPRDRAGGANGRRDQQEAGLECVRGTEGAGVSGTAPAPPSASPPVRRRSALECQRRAEREGARGDRRSGARDPSGHPPVAFVRCSAPRETDREGGAARGRRCPRGRWGSRGWSEGCGGCR